MARQLGPIKWWLYQARRVATNANAAGGPIAIDIALATGQVAKLVSAYVNHASVGNHTMGHYVIDEDNNIMTFLGAAASATTGANAFPSIGSTAGATANHANTVGLLVGPGQKLAFATVGASGQANDTLTVAITLLLSTPDEPTWSKERSTNAADVTLAASSISAANTLQAVVYDQGIAT